jgi:hypothetical protein
MAVLLGSLVRNRNLARNHNLVRIVSMLVGFIRSTSADRIHEERAEYEADNRRLAD